MATKITCDLCGEEMTGGREWSINLQHITDECHSFDCCQTCLPWPVTTNKLGALLRRLFGRGKR